jgi:hypothetical protein
MTESKVCPICGLENCNHDPETVAKFESLLQERDVARAILIEADAQFSPGYGNRDYETVAAAIVDLCKRGYDALLSDYKRGKYKSDWFFAVETNPELSHSCSSNDDIWSDHVLCVDLDQNFFVCFLMSKSLDVPGNLQWYRLPPYPERPEKVTLPIVRWMKFDDREVISSCSDMVRKMREESKV